MKILQFVADGNPGGGTNHVMQLLRGFRQEHELVLLTQKETYLEREAKALGVQVVSGEFQASRLNRNAIRIVQQVIDSHKPDLVHSHGGRAAFFRSLTRSNVPSIYTVHGFHFARKPFAKRVAGWLGEQWAIRNADHIIFVCNFDRDLAIRSKLLPNSKPHNVIYNGIPKPSLKKSSENKLGVGFVGRMVHQKNPELFVETMARLPHARGVMVGGGELEPSVQAAIANRGLEKRIDLRGSLDHKSTLEVLSGLDLLLMTPRWEGLPLLPLEAMFLEVPVVSTSVGGIPEIITDGQNGLLANESASQLAKQVTQVLDDNDFHRQITANASTRVAQQFGQDTMLRAIREVYRSV